MPQQYNAEHEASIQDAIEAIRIVIPRYGESAFSVSFSGGKDSMMLHALIDEALPGNKIPRLYVDTGIEYELMKRFVYDLAAKDGRIVLLESVPDVDAMFREIGYPFKSKQHSAKLDSFQRNGCEMTEGLRQYLEREGRYKYDGCPKVLAHQFSKDYPLKISDRCCNLLKLRPIKEYMTAHGYTFTVTGMRRAEGGRRSGAKLVSTGRRCKGDPHHFNPMILIGNECERYYLESRNVPLCPLYREPYCFSRTGCRGCPLALNLQYELDRMEILFPDELERCEKTFAPVYAEYRRLGYRLRKDEDNA